MGLTAKQQELVVKNQNLVHHIANRLGARHCSVEYDDIISIGTIGLMKAVMTFDSDKNYAFSTYAGQCIKNEILMYYRKVSKHTQDISLYSPITQDSKSDETKTLMDIIEQPYSDEFIRTIENNDIFVQVFNIVLNYLDYKKKLTVLYRMANKAQHYIAKKINVSQSYVARLERKCYVEIREAFTQNVSYKAVFSISVLDLHYKFTFSSKDIHHLDQIYSEILKNMSVSGNYSTGFSIQHTGEQIELLLPKLTESFETIAQIVELIDNYDTGN